MQELLGWYKWPLQQASRDPFPKSTSQAGLGARFRRNEFAHGWYHTLGEDGASLHWP